MKAPVFDFTRALSVAEAVALLADTARFTKPLAGGQSLGPMLNLRVAFPEHLIGVRQIESLRQAFIDPANGDLVLGAAVPHAQIEDGLIPDVTQGLLAHVAANIAYRAVRNRGTVGGSLAHADPAADWVNTMPLLGARMVAVGLAGEREIDARTFMTGPFTTALDEHELLVAVRVPALGKNARWGYVKFCRKPGEFAEAVGGVLIDRARGIGRLVMGATDGAPIVLEEPAERVRAASSDSAVAAHWTDARLSAAIDAAGIGHDPYSAQLHLTMARRAIAVALA